MVSRLSLTLSPYDSKDMKFWHEDLGLLSPQLPPKIVLKLLIKIPRKRRKVVREFEV